MEKPVPDLIRQTESIFIHIGQWIPAFAGMTKGKTVPEDEE
jgi:hypothetical protein